MDESGDTAPSTVPADLKEEIRKSWYKSVWLIVITIVLCVLVSTTMVITDSHTLRPIAARQGKKVKQPKPRYWQDLTKMILSCLDRSVEKQKRQKRPWKLLKETTTVS